MRAKWKSYTDLIFFTQTWFAGFRVFPGLPGMMQLWSLFRFQIESNLEACFFVYYHILTNIKRILLNYLGLLKSNNYLLRKLPKLMLLFGLQPINKNQPTWRWHHIVLAFKNLTQHSNYVEIINFIIDTSFFSLLANATNKLLMLIFFNTDFYIEKIWSPLLYAV